EPASSRMRFRQIGVFSFAIVGIDAVPLVAAERARHEAWRLRYHCRQGFSPHEPGKERKAVIAAQIRTASRDHRLRLPTLEVENRVEIEIHERFGCGGPFFLCSRWVLSPRISSERRAASSVSASRFVPS